MTAAPRISTKPFIADIVFKDGTTRRIDYCGACLAAGFLTYDLDGEMKGGVVMINADTVASIDVAKAVEPAGMKQ